MRSGMYSFLFDRKSFVLLLSGIGLAGVLLFVGGLLVGVQWGLPTDAARVATVCPPAAVPAPVREAALPCVPVEPVPASPELEAEPAPEPALDPAIIAAVSRPVEAEPVAQEPPPLEPQAQEAQEATVAANAAFSIQVGAFSRPENMQKALRELEGRGYAPYVVELSSGRRRVLHSVRIGRYADRAEALRAASDFRQRERMAAIVQPLGS